MHMCIDPACRLRFHEFCWDQRSSILPPPCHSLILSLFQAAWIVMRHTFEFAARQPTAVELAP